MPFTPAHSAAVLPFIKQRYFSAVAAIVGSMTPDFEYFFRMSVKSTHSHTIPGLFYFDLPVTLLLCIVFDQYIKVSLIDNSPVYFQRRFHDLRSLNFLNVLRSRTIIVLGSALFGAGTHLFWDSFTHNGAYFTSRLAIYHKVSIPILGTNYPLFFVLQHISTLIGLSIVAIFVIKKAPDYSCKVFIPRRGYWISTFIIAGIIAVARSFTLHANSFFGNFIVTCISGLCVGLLVAGLMYRRSSPEQSF